MNRILKCFSKQIEDTQADREAKAKELLKKCIKDKVLPNIDDICDQTGLSNEVVQGMYKELNPKVSNFSKKLTAKNFSSLTPFLVDVKVNGEVITKEFDTEALANDFIDKAAGTDEEVVLGPYQKDAKNFSDKPKFKVGDKVEFNGKVGKITKVSPGKNGIPTGYIMKDEDGEEWEPGEGQLKFISNFSKSIYPEVIEALKKLTDGDRKILLKYYKMLKSEKDTYDIEVEYINDIAEDLKLYGPMWDDFLERVANNKKNFSDKDNGPWLVDYTEYGEDKQMEFETRDEAQDWIDSCRGTSRKVKGKAYHNFSKKLPDEKDLLKLGFVDSSKDFGEGNKILTYDFEKFNNILLAVDLTLGVVFIQSYDPNDKKELLTIELSRDFDLNKIKSLLKSLNSNYLGYGDIKNFSSKDPSWIVTYTESGKEHKKAFQTEDEAKEFIDECSGTVREVTEGPTHIKNFSFSSDKQAILHKLNDLKLFTQENEGSKYDGTVPVAFVGMVDADFADDKIKLAINKAIIKELDDKKITKPKSNKSRSEKLLDFKVILDNDGTVVAIRFDEGDLELLADKLAALHIL